MAQGGDLEVLKRNAVLLLQREREVFQLRQERARAVTWLDAFHALSLQLSAHDERALLGRWATLLVEKLGFQIAGAYRHLGGDRHALDWGEPRSRLDAEIATDRELRDFLEAHPGGHYPAAQPEEPLERLAGVLRLRKFHWLSLKLDGPSFLLVAGFSPEAAPFQALVEADQAQFAMLGNHLGALLNSVGLLASLRKERTELQRSNEELESAHRHTRVEMEERLALEEKVRHAQKLEALGRLTAGISHEVNNPLAYVLANLHFCDTELRDVAHGLSEGRADELRSAVAEAIEGAERIGRIIRDVKQFARPDEGQLAAVDVREAIDVALKMCRNEIVHRAQLRTDFGEVPPVLGDARRLQQVFINLLTNAAQAMGDQPVCSIRVVTRREAGGGVCVEVHDNGPGIAPEIADRVYDPFFTTRPIGKGTGLGLWVCRSIVHGFGGRIELGRSDAGGAVARVFLRACGGATRLPRPGDVPAGESASVARRASILIVDDEALVARSIARLLPEHDALAVTTVAEALTAYREMPFDVVLCDLMMPAANGMELFAALQALGPEHARRVVFMTGGAFTPAAREFVETVPNACLDKPLSREALRAAIADSVRG